MSKVSSPVPFYHFTLFRATVERKAAQRQSPPVPFSNRLGNFDDTALQEFVKDKELISVQAQFFIQGEIPHWSLLVQYRLPSSKPAAVPGNHNNRAEDVRTQIPEADWPLYESLRAWRAERSKAEGIPPYIVCTNQHLIQFLQKRPTHLSQLDLIEGFGAKKIEKYGADILALLAPGTEPANG